jgi:hypothetical protein
MAASTDTADVGLRIYLYEFLAVNGLRAKKIGAEVVLVRRGSDTMLSKMCHQNASEAYLDGSNLGLRHRSE